MSYTVPTLVTIESDIEKDTKIYIVNGKNRHLNLKKCDLGWMRRGSVLAKQNENNFFKRK